MRLMLTLAGKFRTEKVLVHASTIFLPIACSAVKTQMPGCPFGNFTSNEAQPNLLNCVRALFISFQ